MTADNEQYWLRQTLKLARRAEEEGEVPVGAVVLPDNEIIGKGWNRPVAGISRVTYDISSKPPATIEWE